MKTTGGVKRAVAAALLAMSGATLAQDTTVRFNGWAYANGSTNAGGGFSVTVNGTDSFIAYCTELSQSIRFGTTYTDYTRVTNAADYVGSLANPGVNGWDPNRASAINERLGQLWAYAAAHYGLTGVPSTSTGASQADSTALQMAIWNVVYDTDNTVSSGAYTFWGSQSLATTANAMLANSLTYGFRYDIDVLRSPGRQDQIITDGRVSPVPEPGTYAMMLAGLTAVGCVARRRRARQG